MQARVRAKIRLQNPESTEDIEGMAEYEKEEELQGAMVGLIQQIRSVGGLLQRLSNLEAHFIPIERIIDIHITVSPIFIATLDQIPVGGESRIKL